MERLDGGEGVRRDVQQVFEDSAGGVESGVAGGRGGIQSVCGGADVEGASIV